jgi:peroxiredoxin
MPLTQGDPAPDFELMNQDTDKVKLSDLRGKTVVLLFYPMDFSPVCTNEHCSFGPAYGKIAPDDSTVVFGVSTDSPFSHAAFKKQHDIPYDLLSDPTRQMVKAYDMFAGEEPFNCGKRGTVVIDPEGNIAQHEEVEILHERTVEELGNLMKK